MSIKLKDMVIGLTSMNPTTSDYTPKKKVNEGGSLDIRKAFYQIGDGIENLEWVGKRHADYHNDKKIQQHVKKLLKAHNDLRKYLDKTYNWD